VDRGPGFPENVLPRAFEPFVTGGDAARTPNDRAQTGGIGLGLALVRRIVEAHGGTVSARNLGPERGSSEPSGAEVTIELPVVAGEPEATPEVPEPAPQPAQLAPVRDP
jgi:signal transduction histidine kinase